MESVRRLCTPHQTVFSKSKAETVANISDLRVPGKINAEQFFGENYITKGMEMLLVQVFDRLLDAGPQGVFRLRQAMGGGKTHNLIATCLLAQNPTIRKSFFSQMGKKVAGLPVRVAVFDGRETDKKDYLWFDLLKQLDRLQKWTGDKDEIPGPAAWAELIGPEPCLIVLDELPPYLESLAMKNVGVDQTEADRLTLALANLMNAIASNRLPNCCLILSDLVGSWQKGSVRIEEAMDKLKNEASRVCFDVTPVRLDGSELYGILRKRLFANIPSADQIQLIAQAYAQAYDKAVQQNAIPASYQRWAGKISETYPFHPGLDDLIARFRENPGFQQTREVLRLAQKMVAQLWEHKSDATLIHPHELDFNDPEVETMLDNINSPLSNARSHDIVQRGSGVAEDLAKRTNNQAPLDAAKLIYLSSLSTATNAVQGLTAAEVAAYLCSPERDVAQIGPALLTSLEDNSWYLHRRTDDRWCYRQTKNVNSAIKERAGVMTEDVKRKQVKEHLEKQFKPGQAAGGTKPVYQKLLVFPAVDDIKLDPNEVTLVISEPREDGLHPDLVSFWNREPWKNRLMFLTGTDGFSYVQDNAAYVKAADDLIQEFKSEGRDDRSPEVVQAKNALENWTNRLRSALRESFTRLYFPFDGKLDNKSLNFGFTANKYVGEETILDSLGHDGEKKFRDDVKSDSFRQEFEELIFSQQTMPWKDITSAMARRSDWYWSPPGTVETLKQQCVLKGDWRDEGSGYVRKGPFPKEKTSVVISQISRDEKTGKAVLNVEARYGDRVHREIGNVLPTAASPIVEGGRLETAELAISFLAIDSTSQHETGAPVHWKNQINLRYQLRFRDGAHVLELECAPLADIRFTFDGSDPKYGKTYTGPAPVPADAVLIQAIAERDDIWSNKIKAEPPKDATKPTGPSIDAGKPAIWRVALTRTGRKEAFDVLGLLKKYSARVRGFTWGFNALQDQERWLQVDAGDRMTFEPGELETLVEQTHAQLPSADDPQDLDASLKLKRLELNTGEQLLQLAKALGVEVKASEVTQK